MRRGVPVAAFALLYAVTLSACGPVSVADAERQCIQRARDATGPHGSVSVGIASDGGHVRPVSGLAVSVGSDWLNGRDPSAVFDQCVVSRAGQMPSRPLTQQPGWSG